MRYIEAIHFSNILDEIDANIGHDYETSGTDRHYFEPRPDYEVWRPANFDDEGIPLSYTAENDVDRLSSVSTDSEDDIPF